MHQDPMPPESTHAQRRVLPYRRGIDGLRAISVLAVLLYHGEVSWMPGGFLGVEVFLVISGYLITSLLLTEWKGSGSLDLGRFWLRRARRLLPALFALLVVSVVAAVLFLPEELARLRGDVAAALGYATNWYLIFSERSYFETFGRPSMLQHLWSLAVEEQFYLFWPLAFSAGMKLLGRRGLLWAVLGGVAASTALMWVLYEPGTDPSRVYYGTDTRAAGLLAGVALALVWHPRSLHRSGGRNAPLLLDLVGAAALLMLIRQFLVVSEYDPSLYRGGFARLAVLTAVVIAVVAHPAARLGRVLGMRPLLWVGLRSYSLYLWHWPVFVLTRPGQDVPLEGVPLLALRLALSLALAALSYRFVEQPFRDGRVARWWAGVRTDVGSGDRLMRRRWALAGAGSMAVVILLGGMMAAAEPSDRSEYVLEMAGGPETPSGDSARPAATGSGNDATSTSPANQTSTHRTTPASEPGTAAAPATTTPPLPPSGQVLCLGDSVMLGAAGALSERLGEDVLVDAVVARGDAGIWSLQYHRQIGTLPDVVVVHLGNNDAYFTDEQFDQLMEELSDRTLVVFLTVKVNQRYEAEVNSRVAAGVERWPNARLADWKGVSEAAAAQGTDVFGPDQTHLNPAGARLYADFVSAQLGR